MRTVAPEALPDESARTLNECLSEQIACQRPDAARLVAVHEEIARTKRRIEEQLADPSSEASGLMALIARADVIALNGGNPDFLKFVLMELAAPFTRAWTERVRAGERDDGG